MDLYCYIEQDGQIVDSATLNCDVIDDEYAVAVIGDVSDSLSFRAVNLSVVIDGEYQILWNCPVMTPLQYDYEVEEATFELTCSGLREFGEVIFRYELAEEGTEPQVLDGFMNVLDDTQAVFVLESGVPEGTVMSARAVYGRIDEQSDELYLLWSA